MKKILILSFLSIGIFKLFGQVTKGVAPISEQSKMALGNTWAVVVGISDYQNSDIPDLTYAHRDAAAFTQYLRSPAGGSVKDDHIITLLNEKATAAQFASALDWLMEKTKEGDQAIIFFSGHGDVERKTITQPGFLLCWDSPAKVYMGGGTFGLIYLQEIISTLSLQTKAKVVVVTDACRSGKLAGSEIGGSHATAANLAKQYANEIKIMSCQPDELSLEGPEWGGGRGVFSYYFLNGITGLADKNRDGIVSLFEIERYLGDKVPEATSPKVQIPITIGNKGAMISAVDPVSLLALQQDENADLYTQGMMAYNAKEAASDQTNEADPILQEKFRLFKKALQEGHLMFPEKNSAWSLYKELKHKKFLSADLASVQSSLAAALQDEAQQAINDYLNADPMELRKRWLYDNQYNKFPIYLNKAAELLGEKHFLYKDIKAREHYFTGLNMRLKGEQVKDTSFYRSAMNEQLKTISLDSNASYAYNELGLLQRRFKKYHEAIHYFDLSIELSPKWVFPWTNKTLSYVNLKNNEMALKFGLISIDVDPDCAVAHYNLATAYRENKNWDEARKHYQKTLELDNSNKDALIDLGFLYYLQRDFVQAEQVVLKFSELYPNETTMYVPALICIYILLQQEEKAIQMMETALKNGYKDFQSIESEQDLKQFIISEKYLALKNKYVN